MKKLLMQINRLFNQRQKKRILLLFMLMIVGSFMEILGVSFVVPLMTAVLQPDIIERNRYIAAFCHRVGIVDNKVFVRVCICTLIIVYIAKNLFLFWQNKKQTDFLKECNYEIQMRLVELYLKRSYEYYLTENTNHMFQIIVGDLGRAFSLLFSLLGLITDMVIACFVVVVVFLINPMMTLCAAVTLLIVMAVIFCLIKPRVNRLGNEVVTKYVARNNWIMQGLRGVKEVKSLHSEDFILQQIRESSKDIRRIEKKSSVLNSVPRLLIETVCVCVMLTFLGVMLVLEDDIVNLIPALGAFAMAAIRLMPAANRITCSISNISYNQCSFERVVEALDQGEADRESSYGILHEKQMKQKTEPVDAICVCGLTYAYPSSNKKVLEDVSMEIPLGKMTCIIGESGAGKTTLVDLILGLLKCQEGEIYVQRDERTVKKETAPKHGHEWRIGYIPQSSFMLDDTIRANVAFGIPQELTDDGKIWECLKRAGIESFVRELPDQLDAKIGEQGIRISGGQRQRFGIARALYRECEIMILDEPTAALDQKTESVILQSIASLKGQQTYIIVAHNPETIAACDIVYEVVDAKVVCRRTCKTASASPPCRQVYFSVTKR